jgi:hypothetical protein
VRHHSGCFAEKQTLIRCRKKYSPPTTLTYESFIVGVPIKSKDGQLKTILPVRLAVTGRGVATIPTKDWGNIRIKMTICRLVCIPHRHRNPNRLPLGSHLNRRFAIVVGSNSAGSIDCEVLLT